ncbi:hypothetical protein MPSEU_001029800 [Mayamaea pseudoterrestris]|nr:hypothetical protein MPSEU_001029800 [Mayamaea pseudoterrestris]
MKSPSANSTLAAILVVAMVGAAATVFLTSNSSSQSPSMTTTTAVHPVASSSITQLRSLQYRTYCGCTECDTDVWNTQAPVGAGQDFTCGKRMKFLQATLSNIDACREVAVNHPDECGVCNPDVCYMGGADDDADDSSAIETTEAPTSGKSEQTSSPTNGKSETTLSPTSGRSESTSAPTSSPGLLVFMGQSGLPVEAFPLGKCQGDCDSDADCADGLYCYPHNAGELIPGCTGNVDSDVDYCVDLAEVFGEGTTAPTTGRSADDDDTTAAATDDGDDAPTDDGTDDAPTDDGTDDAPTDDGTDDGTDDTPTDDGTDDDSSNNDDTTPVGSGDTFKLKIYWQKGYEWQNEVIERKWCLRCSSSDVACDAGRRVYITNCDNDEFMTEWEVSYLDGDSGAFLMKDSNSDNCLTIPDDTQEPLIVDTCDNGNIQQQFFAQNGDAAWGDKFELQSAWIPIGCLGVTHHPRDRETIYIWECQQTRTWTTGLWNFYES